MADKDQPKERKRMIVEEVETTESPEEETKLTPQISEEAAKVSSTVIEEQDKSGVKGIIDENVPPVPVQSKKSSSLALWIVIPLIFILGAIFGGVVFYLRGVNKGQVETTPTPEAVVSTPTPSASPSASVDLTKYTITIFNGSGITGEAGKAKDLLTAAGFKIGSTGNAAAYDYTKTIIKAKTTVDSNFISQLTATLSKDYVMDTNQTLATSSANDVQVVVGSSKAQ